MKKEKKTSRQKENIAVQEYIYIYIFIYKCKLPRRKQQLHKMNINK